MYLPQSRIIFIPLIAVIVFEFFHSSQHHSIEQIEYEQGHQLASNFAQKIQRSITSATDAVLMAEAFHTYADYDMTRFNEWALQIRKLVPNASVVQLAPNGIVTLIEPMIGNEGAVGHDLLKDKRRDDGALMALHNREIVFVGPLRLIQNNKLAVIARKAIFDADDTFWGFAIVIVHLEDIIAPLIEEEHHTDFHISIFGDDPDAEKRPIIYSTDTNYREVSQISLPIKLPFGDWYIEVTPSRKMVGESELIHIVVIVLALALFIILSLFFRYRNRILWERERALEEINKLKGFLPICSVCKNIRDDDGYWQQIESYISEHSETEFSHSICPNCIKKMFGEEYLDDSDS